MRILLLTTHLNFGGIASYTVSLAEELKRRGHEVTVGSSGGDMVERLGPSGIRYLELPVRTKLEIHPKILLAAFKLCLLKKQFDLIHSQTRVTQVLAAITSVITRIPYITTGHGFFTPKFSRAVFPAWGKKTIAISEAVRAHLVKDFHIRKSSCSIIPNGVNIERFRRQFTEEEKASIRREYRLGSSLILGLIARLSPVKGQRYLIEAFALLVKENPRLELLLIGDGPDKKMLQELAKELGISDKVHFAASTIDTTRPLSIIDIFILPSVQEGLGISLAEAMASGVAAVASDVGGIYSLIKHCRTGILVPPKDPQALAEGIKELIEDEGLRKRIARAGQELVAEKFSLAEMAEKTEQVYKEIKQNA